jgi:hypothetical protein
MILILLFHLNFYEFLNVLNYLLFINYLYFSKRYNQIIFKFLYYIF